ncbi:MAG: hypothetical protein CMC14_06140 [Flavobacteriaceae bacterium]|nr:hypothetical protein [Flavobacteriaceae bacterium]|tara:strand:+ start:75962 stop:77197 length:1236 start_codon:yes stop_codon:yes gene_type:complete
MMKKLSLIFTLFLLVSCSLSAQIVTIPDPVFKDMLVNLPCADFDGDGTYESDVDLNNDGEIQVSEAAGVLRLRTNVISGITSVIGIEEFTALEVLNLEFQELTELNITQNVNLTYLSCGFNTIESIDVSQNTALEHVDFVSNNFTSIDVSQNVNLMYLNVSSMNLLEIDITNNTLLEFLFVAGNQITSLDVSNQPLLKELNFRDNSIPSIDLSFNPNLVYLDGNENKLSELDLSNNSLLDVINASHNMIQSIDISNNSSLSFLILEDNNLKQVNLNNNNNEGFYAVNLTENPNLKCIQVDDVDFANAQECISEAEGWCKDETAVYSEDCNLSVEENAINIVKLYPNPVKEVLNIDSSNVIKRITIYNVLGVKLKEITQNFSEISLLGMPAGLLFMEIESEKGTVIQKVIKE